MKQPATPYQAAGGLSRKDEVAAGAIAAPVTASGWERAARPFSSL
jgi:hypothetical protein